MSDHTKETWNLRAVPYVAVEEIRNDLRGSTKIKHDDDDGEYSRKVCLALLVRHGDNSDS